MTSGFHMLREIKLILKINMSGFYLLGGGGGAEAPPPKKKVFPEKN